MGTAGYYKNLRSTAGFMGYCEVLQSTAGYTRGVLGGNYLGTLEYYKYWAELGRGVTVLVLGSALQYPEIPCSTHTLP